MTNVCMNNNTNNKNLSTQIKKGFVWSFIENLSLQGIRFFIGIVMARLLSPSDYGMIGMLTVFMVISDLLVNSGIGSALNQMQNRKEKDFSTAFLFNFVIGIILYGILYFLARPISSFYNVPLLEKLMQVLALSLVINSLCVIPMTKLQIALSFRMISIITVLSAAFSGVVGIYFAMSGYGVWSLVYSTLGGNLLRMIMLYAIVKWIPHTFFSLASFKSMFSYGSKLLLGQLLDTIYSNIYPLVIGKAYSASALGFYSRAQGYANLPSSTISQMIYRVCFPAFCKENNNKIELLRSYIVIMRNVALLTVFAMTLLLSLAQPLVSILITNKWLSCVPMLQILCVATMWYPMLEVNLSVVKALGFSSSVLKMQIITKVFAIIVLVITLNFDIIIMCYGIVIVSLFSVFVNFILSKNIIGLSLKEQLKPLIPSIMAGVLMYVVIAIIIELVDNVYLQCIAGLFIGSTIYAGMLQLLGIPIKKLLYSFIKDK